MVKKQQGFLLIAAVIIMTIVAFFASAIVYMFTGSTMSTAAYLASGQALYTAESGLQKATSQLAAPDIDNRYACTSTGNPSQNIANITYTFTHGTANVTTSQNYPVGSNLTGNLTSTASSINLNSVAGFASRGRVMIDHEIISYNGTSNSPTRLLNVERGQDGTAAASHASGSRVSQYQCNLTSTAYVPNSVSLQGKKELAEDWQQQEAWAVGGFWWTNPRFSRWNGPHANEANAWTNVSGPSSGVTSEPNAISMLNYADGWVVGNTASGAFVIWRRQPSSSSSSDNWTLLSSSNFDFPRDAKHGQTPDPDYITNLNGVSAVSTNDAWAVGDRADPSGATQARYIILHWNGSNWCELDPTGHHSNQSCSTVTIPADSDANVTNLNSVAVIDNNNNGSGDFGFAVGDNGRILEYVNAGSHWTWQAMTSPTTENLTKVFIVSTSEAWAVGDEGKILRWTPGSGWQISADLSFGNITRELNSIYMLDTTGNGQANTGFAVGIWRWWFLSGGSVFKYTGSGWNQVTPSWDFHWYGVTMLAPNDVWIVGGGLGLSIVGEVLHWNGSSWDRQFSLWRRFHDIARTGPNEQPRAYRAETYTHPDQGQNQIRQQQAQQL